MFKTDFETIDKLFPGCAFNSTKKRIKDKGLVTIDNDRNGDYLWCIKNILAGKKLRKLNKKGLINYITRIENNIYVVLITGEKSKWSPTVDDICATYELVVENDSAESIEDKIKELQNELKLLKESKNDNK